MISIFDIETIAPRWNSDDFPPVAYHEIVEFGHVELSGDYRLSRIGHMRADERSTLERFADHISISGPASQIVTWNGRGFDLPVIMARCLHYGIGLGGYFRDFRRRFDWNHIDMGDQFAEFGAARRPKLADYAPLIGLPGKIDVDGSSVAEIHSSGDAETIARYVLEDTITTAALFIAFQSLRGHIDDGHEKIRALLEECAAAEPLAERLLETYSR